MKVCSIGELKYAAMFFTLIQKRIESMRSREEMAVLLRLGPEASPPRSTNEQHLPSLRF